MSDTIIVALLSLAGTLVGSFSGIMAANKLTNYRIEQLEKKVEAHNKLVDRTYKLEAHEELIDQEIDTIKHEIETLEGYHK